MEQRPAPEASASAEHDHVGSVHEAATYLVYTFDAGQRIDTHSVAQRLLKSGIAETVYSAAMPQVRVAPRYAELTKILHRTGAFRDLLAGPITVRAGLLLWLRYPRSGGALIPLVWLFAKLRVKWWSLRFRALLSGRRWADFEGFDEGVHTSDMAQTIEELLDEMETVQANVIESVAIAQSVGAIQMAVDRKLLMLDYWRGEPFVRLGLRGSRHRLTTDPEDPRTTGTEPKTVAVDGGREPSGLGASLIVKADDSTEGDSAEPGLLGDWVDAFALLHRTGVVQVLLRVPLPHGLTTSQLVGRVSSKTECIVASELPEPLLEPMQSASPGAPLLGRWQDELTEGVRWRDITFDEPTSFDDLFGLYFEAFREALPNISPTWLCYPVLMVDGVTCGCSPDEWKTRHRYELASVMFQHADATRFRESLIDDAVEDVSHLRDMVVLLNEARGAVMRWGDDRTANWPDDLHTLIPIEEALLQRGQLALLERQFAQAVSKPRDLERLEEALINGLDEYRSSRINPGDARVLVDRILEKSQSLVGYERLLDSITQLHQKVTAAETRRSARQANLLALLAVLVAAALGLPAIKQSIEIAKAVPKDSRLAGSARPLVWLGEQGAAGVWGAFLILIAVPLVVWLLVLSGRVSRSLRLKRRRSGRAWGIPLDITLVDSADASSASREAPDG